MGTGCLRLYPVEFWISLGIAPQSHQATLLDHACSKTIFYLNFLNGISSVSVCAFSLFSFSGQHQEEFVSSTPTFCTHWWDSHHERPLGSAVPPLSLPLCVRCISSLIIILSSYWATYEDFLFKYTLFMHIYYTLLHILKSTTNML